VVLGGGRFLMSEVPQRAGGGDAQHLEAAQPRVCRHIHLQT